MKNFLIEKELNWTALDGGLSRQIIGYDQNLMQVKVKFEKGGIGSVHHHPHSQCSFVASGKFEVNVNGEKKILNPGDGFYVEPNASHGVICLEEGILVDTFNPARQDFL